MKTQTGGYGGFKAHNSFKTSPLASKKKLQPAARAAGEAEGARTSVSAGAPQRARSRTDGR